MKKKIGLLGVALIAVIMFLNMSMVNGQPSKDLAMMVETCTEAYDRCDAEHPTSWTGFNTCMFMAAACPDE